MNRITALIADDEEAPRAQLRAALQRRWPGLQIVAEAVNGVDAWDAFLEHEPALCLLDIRMPGLTGIEVAERIAGRAQVVFVTAHGDHALAAFDAGAVDYVLKPVDDERLAQALQRVQARLALPAPPAAADAVALQALLAQLSAQVRRPAPLEVIQAGVGKEVRLIRIESVVYFESDARYTRVVHEGGEALIRTPLKELLAQLDAQRFWQVHRSVIVNHHHIAAALRIDEGTMQLSLHGRPEKLPVSRHFQGRFKGQ
ncbi:response regulator transcription factor [Aquincola sp. S2]|uniref:Response regulator transcription factor n=1 Tax=Pseudaquabacterium terrae TaxID=2732868 RepID=A0ABX2EB24_9BURK|nr:LytTR family DNA-binding domain-containing protein [Aquabacterium terrae]NRF66309.1 response regulator transcription factor [Aquabacterium terrae]